MRLIRPLSVGAAALLAAAGLAGPVNAQTPSGVGTAVSSTKVLTAQLGGGQLLDLSLLTDSATSSLDGLTGTPGASSKLSLGNVSTKIVALDAVNKALPTYEAKDTGPTSQDISAGALGLAAPVLQGTVSGGKVFATMKDGVAASGLNVEVVNLTDVLGGLLRVGSASSTLGSSAAPSSTDAGRSVAVKDVTVLDLSAVLQGLGIDIGSLSVDQVVALVDGLAAQTGLPLPSGQTTLAGSLAALNAAIDDLQGSVAGVTAATPIATVTGAIDATTGTLLGATGITVPLPTTANTVTEAQALVNDIVNGLQAQIDDLVKNGVKALDDVALLRLEGVEVGVTTKAVSDTSSSVASVVGKIGKVSVGNLTIASGLDIAAAGDQVSAAVQNVNNSLSTVLKIVHPDLANLVDVAVLQKATSVKAADGYTTATAGVTALSATLTPPASLAAILSTLNAMSAQVLEVADVVGVSSAQVPSALGLGTGMNSLASTLSLGFGALSQPATIKVGQVLAASNYRLGTTTAAPVTPESAPTLPRTGTDTLFLVAAGAIVAGLVARRFLLPTSVKAIRIEK